MSWHCPVALRTYYLVTHAIFGGVFLPATGEYKKVFPMSQKWLSPDSEEEFAFFFYFVFESHLAQGLLMGAQGLLMS